jgi:hypothetical protein
MSAKLNRQLVLAYAVEKEESEEEEYEALTKFKNLEENCEFPIVERKSSDSDTALPKQIPADCIVFTEQNTDDRNQFSVELIRNRQSRASHHLRGMHDYFRHVIYLESTNRLLCTYRMENWIGGGGMAFFVLDATSGALLINKFLK